MLIWAGRVGSMGGDEKGVNISFGKTKRKR
jgi:hypothetical protein